MGHGQHLAVALRLLRHDDDAVAADRYGAAEQVANKGVGGGERYELDAGGHVEQVGRVYIRRPEPDNGRVAADRYGAAELVKLRGIGSGELEELVQSGRVPNA